MNGFAANLRRIPRGRWGAYLDEHSGLPGARANLELADAFAAEADRDMILAFASLPTEYLRFCGTEGIGRLLIMDPAEMDLRDLLHSRASDEFWRVRSAVVRAIHIVGDSAPEMMRAIVDEWVDDSDPWVRRAAVAGICEPHLLENPLSRANALKACEVATNSILALSVTERRTPAVRDLRQTLGYCWSVAVAARPAVGMPAFDVLNRLKDADAQWIAAANLTKSRLSRLVGATAS